MEFERIFLVVYFSKKLIKLTLSPHQRCASSYKFRSGRRRKRITQDCNRLTQVQVGDADEASKVTYLHNAAGQRVFKSEPQVAQTAPSEEQLGTDFITWLKKNFGWLFAQAQQNATLGQSYVYADSNLGSYNLLGEYGNGGSKSAGRMEYIYLPTETGTSQLIGLYKNNRFYAVHTDHLGTPRSITDDTNRVVWQWAYSAFGDNKPTGILKATTNPKAAITNQPKLLTATSPSFAVNLRFPGQYWDDESKLSYNYFRNYQPNQGRYTQADPIGLGGGWSRFGYVGGNPLLEVDPMGLMGGSGSGAAHRKPSPTVSAFGCIGLVCITGGGGTPQMSAELSLGGGIEICDAPPPPPSNVCSRSGSGVQPPGIPVPSGGSSNLTTRGGLFFGPSIKSDGSFCLRLGPHYTVPLTPSFDLGDLSK